MAKIHTRIAAIVLGIAIPVAAAIPASAAITAGESDRDTKLQLQRIERVENVLGLEKGELKEKLAKADFSKVDPAQLKKLNRLTDRAVKEASRVDHKRAAMARFGAKANSADVPVPGLPDTSMLTGLLKQVLDLVKGLLASLGLSLPDLPVPLPGAQQAEGLPGVPGLPDTSFLTDLLKQILDLVKGLLASLGLSLPDLPVPLPTEEDAEGLPGGLDTSFLTDLIDSVLGVVMDLLSGLGLGDTVPDLPVPLPDEG